MWYKKALAIISVIFLIIGLTMAFLLLVSKDTTAREQKITFISPLPANLSSLIKGVVPPKEKVGQNIFPIDGALSKGPLEGTTAQSVISIDLNSNRIIFEKNSKIRRPVASTLKIMTAIVALENNSDLDKKVTISNFAANIGEDVMATSPGETYSLRDLLYGMLILSGNDAAEAIAESTFQRRELFIALMNSKASELGLNDTKFVNPTGLDGDGEHYSTAYDLAAMTRYAMKNPVFRQIVKTKEYVIEQTTEHKGQYIENQTNLLGTYPGVEGVKTGFTPDAGLCLVTYDNYNGHEIVAVVLGSGDRRGDMKKLLDFSFKTIGIDPPKHD